VSARRGSSPMGDRSARSRSAPPGQALPSRRPPPRREREREREDLTRRALYLRSIPVAAELEPRVVHVIAAAFRERDFEAGERMMTEGEPIGAMHLLLDGAVALRRGGAPFGRLAPPQSLGFVGLLAGGDAPYDAFAEADTSTLELDGDALFELLEDHPSFLGATLRYASQRVYHEMRELPSAALAIPFDRPVDVRDRPMSFVERVLFLRTFSIFTRANLNALAALSAPLEEIRRAPGDVLFGEGDEDVSTAYWIASGTVRCDAPPPPSSPGSPARSWRYGPGTVLGGIEGVAGAPRWYGATVEAPLVALRGPSHQFVEMLEDDFTTARTFLAMLMTLLTRLLQKRAEAGVSALAERRDVSSLGRVPVGA
ncbi:MAG TPA: cyclic nucleotide-binding domain-containing protein, partial [Minicystis sp.]|nr:cyclic nucleotide-binding domain-containing protein [Minicystis sp.]